MSDRITKLREDFERELKTVKTDADAKALRDRWVGQGMATGRKGLLLAEMKTLGNLSPEERRVVGRQLNELKNYVEAEIEKLQSNFAAEREAEQLAKERIDVTLPGRRIRRGHLHPITLLRQKIEDIFVSMFYQVEGLLVDRGVTLGDLKGTVEEFVRLLFGPETRTRFRPSYFPFVEPGAEIDYTCFKCGGGGCRVCKGSGWIEMGGSGMVHPNVLRAVSIDPEEFTGFAFGLGLDRLCALMYELDDIRLLYENDVRFLEQFIR